MRPSTPLILNAWYRSWPLHPYSKKSTHLARLVQSLSVLALVAERPLSVAWNGEAILAVVWLGVFGSGAAYLLNFRLLSRIGATRTSILAYFLPIIGIVSGALMFQEHIDPLVLVGTSLVLAGIALVNGRFLQRQLYGRRAPEPGPST